MLCLQASIGALNDLVDAPLDAGQKPAKPLPSGLVSRRSARGWATLVAALGLALSAFSGLSTLAVAAVGLGLGYLYDLRLSRTALSWLPLSLALPLLPTHAWLGATGAVPQGLVVLIPAAVLAGAALAIANGLVDIDRDASAGRATVAVRLGRRRAWPAHVVAFLVVIGMAVALAPAVSSTVSTVEPRPGGGIDALRAVRGLGIPLGAAVIGIGAGLLANGRASIRERGWELEAIGTALLGLGWLAGTATVFGGGGGT